MPSVEIKVGNHGDCVRELSKATDEWVWMRIHELRSVRLQPHFKVSIRKGTLAIELCTPASGEQEVEADSDCDFECKVVDIWKRMDLHCSDYTAGAAVCFLRHLRSLVDGQLQQTVLL